MPQPADVTQHLRAARRGDAEAASRLWEAVYGELHRAAHRQLRQHRPGYTLNTTSLVHEAYLKLVRQEAPYENRLHFFAVSATVMRRIIIDYARRKGSQKRGGDLDRVTLEADHLQVHQRATLLLDLNDALGRLATFDERLAKVVECRFFGGMALKEIASLLGLSVLTIKRDWRKARAWLARELQEQEELQEQKV